MEKQTFILNQLIDFDIPFPTQKNENFRYFPLHHLIDKEFSLYNHSKDVPSLKLPFKEYQHLKTIWIIDSFPYINNENNSTIELTKKRIENFIPPTPNDFFKELNRQYSSQIGSITLTKEPLHIIFVNSINHSINFPALDIINECKSGQIYISFISYKENQKEDLTTVSVPYIKVKSKKDNHLQMNILVNHKNSEMILPYIELEAEKDSTIDLNLNYLNGKLTRFSLEAVLNGENTHFNLKGLYNTTLKNQAEVFVKMYHLHKDSHSNQFFKGVAHDQSHFSFNGDIVIAPFTPNIIAHQLSKNLLLGKQAKVMVRPQLHVKHQNIQCSHGATIGSISKEELFYLNSRGIEMNEAKRLLLKGFLDEIIQKYSPDWGNIITNILNQPKD